MKSKPILVAFAFMAATIMQVLDGTIINVALPNMAGQLNASPDNNSGVLTS
jgi:DHA2 family multidrug resistance protein